MLDETSAIEIIRLAFAEAGSLSPSASDQDSHSVADIPSPAVNVDAHAEGIHFQLDPWRGGYFWIGRRAFVAAASDLLAVRAAPSAIFMSLELPSEFSGDILHEIATGMAREAAALDAYLIGGNVIGGPRLTLHTTVIGDGRAYRGMGVAHPGDALVITGAVGDEALALEAGLSATEAEHESLLAQLRWPSPPFGLIPALREIGDDFHGATDISDGWAQNLRRFCAASEIGCAVDADRIPRSDLARRLFEGAGGPRMPAYWGGDAYQLLIAVDSGRCEDLLANALASGVACVRAGTFDDGVGCRLLTGGNEIAFPATGYDSVRPSI